MLWAQTIIADKLLSVCHTVTQDAAFVCSKIGTSDKKHEWEKCLCENLWEKGDISVFFFAFLFYFQGRGQHGRFLVVR